MAPEEGSTEPGPADNAPAEDAFQGISRPRQAPASKKAELSHPREVTPGATRRVLT